MVSGCFWGVLNMKGSVFRISSEVLLRSTRGDHFLWTWRYEKVVNLENRNIIRDVFSGDLGMRKMNAKNDATSLWADEFRSPKDCVSNVGTIEFFGGVSLGTRGWQCMWHWAPEWRPEGTSRGGHDLVIQIGMFTNQRGYNADIVGVAGL
jgi:hypothetical protein